MLVKSRSIMLVGISLVAANAWGGSIAIDNPGFTAGGTVGWTQEYSGSGGNNSGWNDVVSAGWFAAPANSALSSERALILYGSNAAYRQELTTTFQSNSTYTLQFDIGAPDRDPDNFRTVSDYHVGLWRGGSLGTWMSGELMFEANNDFFGNVATTAGAGGVWKHVVVQWTSGNLSPEVTSSPIQVRVGEAGDFAIVDNIQLDVQPVPEPAASSLLALAIPLLLPRRGTFARLTM